MICVRKLLEEVESVASSACVNYVRNVGRGICSIKCLSKLPEKIWGVETSV